MGTNNAYCTNAELQSWMGNDQTWTAGEQLNIDIAIDAASREIEEYCNRKFYLDSTTSSRVYAAAQYSACFIDDVGDLAGFVVKTDSNGDGAFDITWTSTEFQTEPFNAIARGRPVTTLRATAAKVFPIFEGSGVWLGVSNGRSFFAPGAVLSGIQRNNQALVQVTAKWGWPSVPPAIKQGTLIQASMLYQAKNAPTGIMGNSDMGQMRYTRGLHPTVELLIEPYRSNAGGVLV